MHKCSTSSPVEDRLSIRSLYNKKPASDSEGSRLKFNVDCPEGGYIKINSNNSRSNVLKKAETSSTPEPGQSIVTVRPICSDSQVGLIASCFVRLKKGSVRNCSVHKDINLRTHPIKDGVQFSIDGQPGMQMSIKMGEACREGPIVKNTIKIETETPATTEFESGGRRYGVDGKVIEPTAQELMSYARPTVSHLIRARMTQLYKEIQRAL